MTVSTTHYTESGPVPGFVYLVMRNDKMSVKIGSTIFTPSSRLSCTPTCSQKGFLIACRTTATRELEGFLHTAYSDKKTKLKGRDNFALTVEHIIALANWFDGGVFPEERGGDGGELTLVDRRSNQPESGWDRAQLVGNAVRVVMLAEYSRDQAEKQRQDELRKALWWDWEKRAAKEWGITHWEVRLRIATGEILPHIGGVYKSIEAGRSARVPARPRMLDKLERVS